MASKATRGCRPVWSPTNLGSITRRKTQITPHTASMAMPRSQLPMAMRMMDQGTITVPEPVMGIKSMMPSSTANRMP